MEYQFDTNSGEKSEQSKDSEELEQEEPLVPMTWVETVMFI